MSIIKTRKIEEKIRNLDVDDSVRTFLLKVFDWEAQATTDRGHYTKFFEECLEDAFKSKEVTK